jgi:hypothetical protein
MDDLEAQKCMHLQQRVILVDQIKDKAVAWVKAGAKGLQVVLPTTWDVH